MEILPLGDAALIVRVVDDYHADPVAAMAAVRRAHAQIVAANIAGITDVTPAYATLGVFFDAMLIGPWKKFVEKIRATVTTPGARLKTKSRIVEVPVCYHPSVGIDIADVARHAGVEVDEVARLHAGATYRVSCVGFAPGFPYLAGLPVQLATPRRATPRTAIPAGSVAIGGSHTGIYPHASPGGWNVIGRTPLRLFDPAAEPPALLQVGDEVRFRAISHEEFLALAT